MRIRILPLFFLLTSCIAYHHGTISESSLPDGKQPIEFVHGYSRVNRVLLFGGLRTDALIAEAKRNMFLNHPLQEGQYFANYVVDFKESFQWLIFHTTQVVITAEVIGTAPSSLVDQTKENATLERKGFRVGEIVSFQTRAGNQGKVKFRTKAKIIEFPLGGATIGYVDATGRYQVKNVPVKRLRKLESTE